MMQFRPVEHAITEDGEWVTVQEVPFHYRGRLLCDSCHTEVIIQEVASGKEIFVHARRHRRERLNNQSCHYAIRPPKQPVSTRAGRGRKQPPAGYAGLRGPLNTRRGLWRCNQCERSYYGVKKCPHCGEWVYTISR
ncbi:putative zinc ribbon protein [Salmonella enterica]